MDVFPCGCSGYFEYIGTKKRLVVMVNPNCKYDAEKTGKVLAFVRYMANIHTEARA